MPESNRYDGRELLDRPIGWDRAKSPLSDDFRWRDGRNAFIDEGDVVRKREGFVVDGSAITTNLKVVWIQVSAGGVLAVSALDTVSTKYELWYRKPAGAWTLVPTKRGLQQSDFPHEAHWIKEKLYVRGFPGSGVDLYGSVVFDADAETTAWWGVSPPTTAPAETAQGGWSASASPITVVTAVGLRYAYAWVTSSGHVSGRSPLSAGTGAFTNLDPVVNITGNADTANIPFINVYRTGDGGGTAYFLEQIANTGVGPIAYLDDNSALLRDGVPITGVDTSRPAAGPLENDVPPTVESGTIGSDPIERSSPLAFAGGRIWFAVGKHLYYSVNDEAAKEGALLESFRPAGGPKANRIEYNDEVTELVAGGRGLWVFTKSQTFFVSGAVRRAIESNIVYSTIGCSGRRRAVLMGDTVVWLDQNLDVRAAAAGRPTNIGFPTQRPWETGFDRVELLALRDQVAVVGIDETTPTNSRIWVLDLLRSNALLWYVPWEVEAQAAGVVRTSTGVERLATFNAGAVLAVQTPGVWADRGSSYSMMLESSVIRTPPGNQVNLLRGPGIVSATGFVKVAWTGATPSAVETAHDDLSSFGATTRKDPPKALTPAGYSEGFYWSENVVRDLRVRVTGATDSNDLRLLRLAVGFDPRMGD